ncbi:hypothetical protein FQN58_23560 [Bacteroides xylanisolvens]|uniref:hypothetical protein n=1 Tax=Bacteroides xylanisolvens TaxID=371601 RepID=UPI001BA6511D|nr:hypothetical protein [Bacteroides xylanisolvens]QUR45946.1 hypothetical protein FQN58_23560 [Bacteroides xylanisolvens]
MENEKKDPRLSDEVVKLQKHRIMLWCAIIIITFFLIVQFSVANCENKVLADQFTFASTISSIILSVIAIIMSVVSGESINNLLHKFRDVHDEISDVPGKIDSSIQKMDDSSGKFDEIYSNLKDTPQKIEKATQVMAEASGKIDESVQHLHQVMDEFQEKTKDFHSLKNELKSEIRDGFQSVGNTTAKQSENENILTSEQTTEVLKSGSPWGALLLYAIKRSKDEKKYFLLKHFCEKFELKNREDYFYGYFIAMRATGIFEVKEKQVGKKIEIINYNRELDNMKRYLPEYFPKSKISERIEAIEQLIIEEELIVD